MVRRGKVCRGADADLVAAEGGEVGEEVGEGVGGVVLGGAGAAGLGVGGSGAGGWLDGVGRCEWGVVGEQQWREALLEFEGDVVGEHAEEHVRADAVFEVVVDRADLDRVFHRSERALGHLELLVGADRGGRAEPGVRGGWCGSRRGRPGRPRW